LENIKTDIIIKIAWKHLLYIFSKLLFNRSELIIILPYTHLINA